MQGQGIERVFPMHSPFVQKVEVKRSGKVRRARLYFLRDRMGKATRLKEIIRPRAKKAKKAPKVTATPAPVAAPEPDVTPDSESPASE